MAQRKAFPLRINEALYADLRSWADAEFRSVNAQIEFLLREAVRKRKGRLSNGGEPSPDAPGADDEGDTKSPGEAPA